MVRARQRPVPYYQQVANILRARIISIEGDTPVQLPTERELCQVHQVSRETVRQALEVLEKDGLIERARSRGTLTVPAGIRAWRRLRHSRVIKLVTSARPDQDVPTSFYGRLNQGIFQRSEQAGYSISAHQVGPQFPGIEFPNDPEDPAQVLGVIISGVQDERIIAMHAQVGYPVVVVDYWSRNALVDSVVIDCFGEGERAAEFLLEQGHHCLFFLGNAHGDRAKREHEADADLLLAGFERALRRHNVVLPPAHIFFCRQDIVDVREVLQRVAALRLRPTAGLVFSSPTMRYFQELMREAGLACPEDISLICKADVGEEIDAATLRGSSGLMGQRAVDLLLERVAGRRSEPVCLALRSSLQRGPTVRQMAQP